MNEMYNEIVKSIIEKGYYKKLRYEKVELLFQELNRYLTEKNNGKCNDMLLEPTKDNFKNNVNILSKITNNQEELKKYVFFTLSILGTIQDKKIAWFTNSFEDEKENPKAELLTDEFGNITRLSTNKVIEQDYAQVLTYLYEELLGKENFKQRIRK